MEKRRTPSAVMGVMTNADGKVGEKHIWGQPSDWVHYAGRAEEKEMEWRCSVTRATPGRLARSMGWWRPTCWPRPQRLSSQKEDRPAEDREGGGAKAQIRGLRSHGGPEERQGRGGVRGVQEVGERPGVSRPSLCPPAVETRPADAWPFTWSVNSRKMCGRTGRRICGTPPGVPGRTGPANSRSSSSPPSCATAPACRCLLRGHRTHRPAPAGAEWMLPAASAGRVARRRPALVVAAGNVDGHVQEAGGEGAAGRPRGGSPRRWSCGSA